MAPAAIVAKVASQSEAARSVTTTLVSSVSPVFVTVRVNVAVSPLLRY